jgi:hypothetical protein
VARPGRGRAEHRHGVPQMPWAGLGRGFMLGERAPNEVAPAEGSGVQPFRA